MKIYSKKTVCANCELEISGKLEGNISILRHGRTAMNAKDIIIGSIDDPLDAEGIQQAQRAAENFKKAGLKFDTIITSPLLRAVVTAKIIAESQYKKPIYDNRLREQYVAEFEGKPVFPDMLRLFLSKEILCQNAEPLSGFNKRVSEFLDAVQSTKNNLVVCHGLTLLAMLRKIKRWDLEQLLAYKVPKNCVPITFGLAQPCTSCGSKFYESSKIC